MRRLNKILIGLCTFSTISFVGYSGGYYYVTAEWPWQQNVSAAELVLRDIPLTATPAARAVPANTDRPTRIAASLIAPADTAPNSSTTTPVQTNTPAVAAQGMLQEGAIHSAFMHGDMPFLIYLPPGYNDPSQAQRSYPVVYLLHGSPGRYTDWTSGAAVHVTTDALMSIGRIPPLILVMPEGHCTLTNDSGWVDSDITGLRAESYLVGEVVPFIDAHYRTLADRADRAIGGLSSGASGAVNTALHHPDMFGTALGLSGSYGTPTSIIGQALFTSAASKAYNRPLTYVAQMANPQQLHVYLVVGTQDKLDGTLHSTQQMEQALFAAKVPHDVEYAEGAHSWHFWGVQIIRALGYVVAQLPQSAR